MTVAGFGEVVCTKPRREGMREPARLPGRRGHRAIDPGSPSLLPSRGLRHRRFEIEEPRSGEDGIPTETVATRTRFATKGMANYELMNFNYETTSNVFIFLFV